MFDVSLKDLLQKTIDQLKSYSTSESEPGSFTLSKSGTLQMNQPFNKAFQFNGGTIVDLDLEEPKISGLQSVAISNDPTFFFQSGTIQFGVEFKDVTLDSGPYSYTVKNNRFLSNKTRCSLQPAKITFPKIEFCFSLQFDLDLFSRNPSISAAGSSCFFPTFKFEGKWTKRGNVIALFLIPYLRKKVSSMLEKRLSSVLTSQLITLYQEHKCFVDTVASAYQLKLDQGGWEQGKTPRMFTNFNGVGEMPLPTIWELPAVETAEMAHLDVDDVMDMCQTGDLLLFSGTAPSSQRIRRMTQCAFSHVVMIVKNSAFEGGVALLWQATASSHHGVLREREFKSGIQLNPFAEMINEYRAAAPGAIVVYRKLQFGKSATKEQEDRHRALVDYIHLMDGKAYTKDMDKLYFKGLFEVHEPGEDYFCAGLVAESLMLLGVLEPAFMQHQYAPRDFSTCQKNLPLTEGSFFAPNDIVVNPEPDNN